MANTARCLILACGNTLRSDDGVGPKLAAWAEERFRQESEVRVISRQQFTPELAELIAAADSLTPQRVLRQVASDSCRFLRVWRAQQHRLRITSSRPNSWV